MKKEKRLFLTGATGFIGASLAYKFLKEGYSLVLLVRDKKEPAEQRIEKILSRISYSLTEVKDLKENIKIIRGDITKPCLGLKKEELLDISRVYAVFHCAANTTFDKKFAKKIEEDNVRGTKNILEILSELRIFNFHYMSTAYVCGQSRGVFYEEDLDKGQRFNNPYEESKFKAEMLVREYSSRYKINTTIYRPSIVIGSSEDGRSLSFAGFYSAVRALYTMSEFFKKDLERGGRRAKLAGVHYENKSLYIPMRIPVVKNKTLNLIPIDYLVKIVFKIFTSSQHHGKVYHIVNPYPPTIEEISRLLCKVLNISGISLIDPEDREIRWKSYEKLFMEMLADVLPYLKNEEPLFSDINTKSILKNLSFSCPPINLNLMGKLVDYYIRVGRKSDEYLFNSTTV